MFSDALRSSRAIWFIRIFQLLNVLVAIATAAEAAASFVAGSCNVPGRIAYNLAAGALTLPFVIYFIITTGIVGKGFWNPWVQIGLDSFFFVIWIAATATSPPDCGDICNACTALGQSIDEGAGFSIISGSLTCGCLLAGDLTSDDFQKRSLNFGINSGKLLGARDVPSQAGTQAALIVRETFEALLILDFLINLVLGLLILFGYVGKSRGEHNVAPDHFQMTQSEYGAQAHTGETDVAGNPIAYNQ